MADEILPNTGMELPDVGADDDAWGDILNDNLRILDNAVTLGKLDKTLSNVNITLTNDELSKGIINLIGAITANVNVLIQPNPSRMYLVRNGTTGAFSVTIKTPSGSGVTVTQGFSAWVYSDGTNIVNAGTSISNALFASNGFIGIGTSAPSTTLAVQNTGANYAAVARFTRVNGTDNAALRIDIDPTNNLVALDSTGAATGALSIRRGGTETALFDASGNLGLGVAPSAWRSTARALQLGASSALEGLTNNGSYVALYSNAFNNGTNFVYQNTAQAALYQHSLGVHSWYTAPTGTAGNAISFTQAMTLDASGNLGVGTTSPGYRIHASAAGDTTIRIASTNGQSPELSLFSSGVFDWRILGGTALRFVSDATERARIDSSGNLLVGTTNVVGVGGITALKNGTSGFSIVNNNNAASSGYVFSSYRRSSGEVGSITQNGTTGVLYNTTSDYRLKTVVGPVVNAGSRIDQLNPVVYFWKNSDEQTRGFLAHEFAEIYPKSVNGQKDAVDDEGNPVYQNMQASTSEVIADLVAEIKSLRARVAALEAS